MTIRGEDLLKPAGPVAAVLGGYECRDAQLQMARAIDELLTQKEGQLLVEAGTGVGKSLAYLAPAMASGLRVVVATGTKALQDQLARDDAPLLCRALEKLGIAAPRVEVVKGRNNYLCQLRFDRISATRSLPGLERDDTLAQIEPWLAKTTSGDRAELTTLPDDLALWGEIDAGADTCVGTKCDFYERCFIVRLRERARAADLIITNHHLLMADEALRLGQRFGEIPDSAELLPDHDLLIVDEAHGLQAVATDAFSAAVSSAQLERLSHDALVAGNGLARTPRLELEAACRRVDGDCRACLERLVAHSGDAQRRLEADDFDDATRQGLASALEAIDALGERARRHIAEQPNMEAVALRARRLQRALEFIASGAEPRYVNYGERRRRQLRVVAAPIEVAEPLTETLFRSGRRVVLTSATLCTDRGFGAIRRQLGLDQREDVTEQQLASPFPYAELVRYYLPAEPIIPDSSPHLQRLAEEMEALCRASRGGAFLLFTSHRVLNAVHERLASRLQGLVLRQGERPRRALLEAFRADGDAILFGTSSFWEGVDVRGAALRLVAIDRLPFSSPADPLYAARQRLLEERGERPFTRLALPGAILELKQGIGRLVRSSTDRGVIALLDGRVETKGYGRRFLRALPQAPRLRQVEEVARFFGTGAEGA